MNTASSVNATTFGLLQIRAIPAATYQLKVINTSGIYSLHYVSFHKFLLVFNIGRTLFILKTPYIYYYIKYITKYYYIPLLMFYTQRQAKISFKHYKQTHCYLDTTYIRRYLVVFLYYQHSLGFFFVLYV